MMEFSAAESEKKLNLFSEAKSWKLVVDPFLKKGSIQKVFRFDGVSPVNPAYNVHHLSDPRTLGSSRYWSGHRDFLDLPVPPFKIDENFVGKPPPKEVSFIDLNDNISPAFLSDLCKKCGDYEELKIFYHPTNKRHLGLGFVLFKNVKAASLCVEKYDGTSIMGKTVHAFLDAFGKEVKKLFDSLSSEEAAQSSSAKEATNNKYCKRQTINVSAASTVATAENGSVSTPQSSAVVPEDPMNSQQADTFVNPLQQSIAPAAAAPQYMWHPQNYVWPTTVPPPWLPPGPVSYQQGFIAPFPSFAPPLPNGESALACDPSSSSIPAEETIERKKDKEKEIKTDIRHGRDSHSSEQRRKSRERTPPDRRRTDERRNSKGRGRRSKERTNTYDARRSSERPLSSNKLRRSPDRKRRSTRSGSDERRSRERPTSSTSKYKRRDSPKRCRTPQKRSERDSDRRNRCHASPIARRRDEKHDYREREKEARDEKRKTEDSSRNEKNGDRHRQRQPIIETVEEYYRRKKLPLSSSEKRGTSSMNARRRRQSVNRSDSSSPPKVEIEEYKYISRKLLQRVSNSKDDKRNSRQNEDGKLENISSSEEDEENKGNRRSARMCSSASKFRKKSRRKTKRSNSSLSSSGSSVQLRYSSLSGEESSFEKQKNHHRIESGRQSQKEKRSNEYVEHVISSDSEDYRRPSSQKHKNDDKQRRNVFGSRDKNEKDKHANNGRRRDDVKDALSERVKNRHTDEVGATGSGTPLIDEPVLRSSKPTAGRSSDSTLERRIQNILRLQTKVREDDGTPLQDEPRTVDSLNEPLSNMKVAAAVANDDDDKMSLSSGSRPTSRNDADATQKVAEVDNKIPSLLYQTFPMPFNTYDPNMYTMMYQANMPAYCLPGAIPFPAQHYPPMWAMPNATCVPPPPFATAKPPIDSTNLNNPEIIRHLTYKACGRVVKDLRSVLNKDVMKRLIETSAFQCLDTWFVSQQNSTEVLRPKMETLASTPSSSSVQASAVLPSLSRLFEQDASLNKPSGGDKDLAGIFGLGLRASLPKLPSFKRKPVTPPPADVRKGYRERNRRDRKKEKVPDKTTSPKGRRKVVSSSSSSHSSSSSDDGSSEESEEEDKHEIREKASVSKKSLSSKDRVIVEDSSSDEHETKVEVDEKPVSATEDSSESEETVEDESDVNNEVHTEEAESDDSSSVPDEEDSDDESSDDNEKTADDEVRIIEQKPADDVLFGFTKTLPHVDDNCGVYEKALVDSKSRRSNKHQVELIAPDLAPIIRDIDEPPCGLMKVDEHCAYTPNDFDHCYFQRPVANVDLVANRTGTEIDNNIVGQFDQENSRAMKQQPRTPKKSAMKVSDLLNMKRSKFVDSFYEAPAKKAKQPLPVTPYVPAIVYKPRDALSETKILYDFLTNGIDEEDINFLKRSFDQMVSDSDALTATTQWIPHVHTSSPPLKKRRIPNEHVHATGSARTEGFYRPSEKMKRTSAAREASEGGSGVPLMKSAVADQVQAKQQLQLSREARSNQRRLLNTLGDADYLKFNQLKYRKKLIRFSKSKIHGWGLFALEPIGPDEMIIEYVGEKVRLVVAEKREKNYEKMGIGSSYLFRLDNESAIDATKRGAVARFINHSCNPSCYAKIINFDGEKRIVIYSKQNIAQGEEITYDYKFPFEDVKIPCNCGAHNCRGSLN